MLLRTVSAVAVQIARRKSCTQPSMRRRTAWPHESRHPCRWRRVARRPLRDSVGSLAGLGLDGLNLRPALFRGGRENAPDAMCLPAPCFHNLVQRRALGPADQLQDLEPLLSARGVAVFWACASLAAFLLGVGSFFGVVGWMHESLQHLVAGTPWGDEAMLAQCARAFSLRCCGKGRLWLGSRTTPAFRRRARSAGVACRDCGPSAKQDDCGAAVSLPAATWGASLPTVCKHWLSTLRSDAKL